MRTISLTLPASAERDNEDAIALADGIGVVVDGAGIPAELRRGCTHTVAWYSRALADAFCARLADRGTPMRDALAGAIAEVTARHAGTCTFEGGSPSATVAAWRVDGAEVEHLVLCDASIVLRDVSGRTREITDDRIEHSVERRTRELLSARTDRTKASPDELAALRWRALEECRNAPDGFWCAQTDPEVVAEALVGRQTIVGTSAVIAASDGGTRGFQLVDAHDLRAFARRAECGELAALAAEIRAGEEHLRDRSDFDGKIHDDLTIVVGSFG
ncbi:MAG: protein phosphatase 2C domain-containing protein [Microbacterium sp.]|uniref:protein phosphatase 2C domain-containing protein n=1 Tax=Microbacterium sp. TaxID=51671 RepID=UPI002824D888|nr:protein phosphatase 2C domain-containing protein [Microbacterium sp.]MDR2321884.1 protein phosphatase 2C domain-containing protein [Microbacterium sp.]